MRTIVPGAMLALASAMCMGCNRQPELSMQDLRVLVERNVIVGSDLSDVLVLFDQMGWPYTHNEFSNIYYGRVGPAERNDYEAVRIAVQLDADGKVVEWKIEVSERGL
jgi:hypothetical protein